MSELIKLTDLYLLCDACGHRDLVDGYHADLIGRPCPKCGADMLTQKDYDDTLKLLEGIALLNGLFGASGLEAGEEDAATLRMNPHDGALNIRVEPKP